MQLLSRGILFMICCLAAPINSAQASPRLDMRLSGEWRFIRQDVAGAAAVDFDDSAWQSVNLPHTWNNLDGQTSGAPYYRGIGWYRRHLQVDAQHAGQEFISQVRRSRDRDRGPR